MTKMKAFADDRRNEAQMMISVFDRVVNIVGKGENAGYQHFILFPQSFQEASYTGSLKVGMCGEVLIIIANWVATGFGPGQPARTA